MKKEIWIPIHGAVGYEISTNLSVRSWIKGNPKGHFILDKPKVLTPSLGTNGYYSITIKYGDKIKHELLHRIIAKHFITNFFGYDNVNHINGDKSDNRIENLEWCNQSMNSQHAIRIGLNKIGNDKSFLETKDFEINGLVYKVTPNGRVFINGREKHPMATNSGKLGIYFDRKNQIDVHRLVALLYIPNPENKKYVVHINGLRNDNRVLNLMWATKQEVAQYHFDISDKTKVVVGVKGRFNSSSKTVNQIDRNTGIIIKEWDTMTDAAKHIGTTASAICKVANGNNKTAGGYVWEYADRKTYT